MKRVVVTTGLHDADIRPPSLLSEFKRLSVAEAREYFGDPATLTEVACPACDCGDCKQVFEKESFHYNKCEDCGSVYVSPRPTQEALSLYYRNSKASQYRVEHFARQTAEARRSHILSSQASWLGQMVDESDGPVAPVYVDIGTNQPDIFDEVRKLGIFDESFTWAPLPGIEDACFDRGVKIIQEPIFNAGVVTAFQQIEHQFSPFAFAKSVSDMLAIGGLFFFSTRTIDGFDLQMLWDRAPYIYPPEHLNLLSIDGISRLVERAGLGLIELSTPGQLDVELVARTAREDPEIKLPEFVRYLLNDRGERAHEDFQAFLQKHRLSSYVRVAAARGKGSTG